MRKAEEDADTIRHLQQHFQAQCQISSMAEETAETRRVECQDLQQELYLLRQEFAKSEQALEVLVQKITSEYLQLPVHRREWVRRPKDVRTNRVRSLKNALDLSQNQHADAERRARDANNSWAEERERSKNLENRVQNVEAKNNDLSKSFDIARGHLEAFTNAVPAFIKAQIASGSIEGLDEDILETVRHEQLTIDAMEEAALENSRLRGKILGLEHDHQQQITRIHRRVNEPELENRRLDAQQYEAVSRAVGLDETVTGLRAQLLDITEYKDLLEGQSMGSRAETIRERHERELQTLKDRVNAILNWLGESNTLLTALQWDGDLCLELVTTEFLAIRELAAQREYLFNLTTYLRTRFATQLHEAPLDLALLFPEFAKQPKRQQAQALEDEARISAAWERARFDIEGKFPTGFAILWSEVCRITRLVRLEWGWKVDYQGNFEEESEQERSLLVRKPSGEIEQGLSEVSNNEADWEDASSDENDSESEDDVDEQDWEWN